MSDYRYLSMDPDDYLDQKYGGYITGVDIYGELRILLLDKLEMRQRLLLRYESKK